MSNTLSKLKKESLEAYRINGIASRYLKGSARNLRIARSADVSHTQGTFSRGTEFGYEAEHLSREGARTNLREKR